MSTTVKIEKFKLTRKNVRSQLLRGEEIRKILEEIGEEKAKACGKGYAVRINPGRTRTNVFVEAKTKEARLDNAENNTLLKVFGI